MGHRKPSPRPTRRSRVTDLVTITGIAVGGDGVGRLADGRVVFIPRTAPGDRVHLREQSLGGTVTQGARKALKSCRRVAAAARRRARTTYTIIGAAARLTMSANEASSPP